jgi:hypothetical protein
MGVESGMEAGEGLGEWMLGWSLFFARTPEGGGGGGFDSSDKDESDELRRKLMRVSLSPEEGGGREVEVDGFCEGGRGEGEPLSSLLSSVSR